MPCSIRIAIAFIEDPTAPMDTACLSDVDPPGFEPSTATSLAFFGTADAWGDAPEAAIVPASVFAEAEELQGRLRARYTELRRAGR